MNVVVRAHRGRGRLHRRSNRRIIDLATIKYCLDRAQSLRPIAHADDPDMRVDCVACSIQIVKERGAGHREVSPPLSKFLKREAPSGWPSRKPDPGDDLVRLQLR